MPWSKEGKARAYREHKADPTKHPHMYTPKYKTKEERYAAQSQWLRDTNHARFMHTPEARKKSALANKGKKISLLTRMLISKANKGRTYSDETKKRMSEGAKRRITDEFRSNCNDRNAIWAEYCRLMKLYDLEPGWGMPSIDTMKAAIRALKKLPK